MADQEIALYRTHENGALEGTKRVTFALIPQFKKASLEETIRNIQNNKLNATALLEYFKGKKHVVLVMPEGEALAFIERPLQIRKGLPRGYQKYREYIET